MRGEEDSMNGCEMSSLFKKLKKKLNFGKKKCANSHTLFFPPHFTAVSSFPNASM